jgi:hypothetical protein
MPPEQPATLPEIVERLERAAVELRADDLAPARAAGLVDECARLAAEASTLLDQELRAADHGPAAPGQLRLAP